MKKKYVYVVICLYEKAKTKRGANPAVFESLKDARNYMVKAKELKETSSNFLKMSGPWQVTIRPKGTTSKL